MFWNNHDTEKEKEERKKGERERENIYMRSLNGENDCPFYLTPCPRDRKKKKKIIKATSIKYNVVIVMYFY
jgi:hypothetical protein